MFELPARRTRCAARRSGSRSRSRRARNSGARATAGSRTPCCRAPSRRSRWPCRRDAPGWLIGIVPVRPVASFSLKSDSPWQPSERQKRITVGWLTSALRAMSTIGSLMIERGWFSARSATRRSAGVSASRIWRIRSNTADDAPPERFDNAREDRRHAEERRVFGGDQVGRDVLEVVREATLRLEARANDERVNSSPSFSATPPPMYTPPSAERQRDAARERAENPAEAFDRLERECVAACARSTISTVSTVAATRFCRAASAR